MVADDGTTDDDWVPVAGAAEPEPSMEFDDLDYMLDVTHPIRGVILRHLSQPHTVAEVADAMGVPVTRLYHHINRLTEHGIIRIVATRQVAAVTERRYQAAAKSYRLSAHAMATMDLSDLATAMCSVFDLAKLGMQRLIESGAYREVTDPEGHSTITLGELRLGPDRRRDLIRRLDALLHEFKDISDLDEPDAEPFTLFFAGYPEPASEATPPRSSRLDVS